MHRDFWAGLAFLVVTGAIGYVTTTFREVPPELSQNVPPTFFPRLVLLVLGGLSLLLLLSGLRRVPEEASSVPRDVFLTALVFGLTVWLIPRLGTFVTVFLFAVVLPLYWGERRKLPLTLFAVALPAAIYLVFGLALGLRLPRGVFF